MKKSPRVLTAKNLLHMVIISVACLLFINLTSCANAKRCAKFCSPQDTVITIHDTVRTETIRTDTVFSAILDTVVLTKDKLTVRYIKVRDSIYLSGECVGDTVYITKQIPIRFTTPKLTLWQTIKGNTNIQWIIIAAFIAGFILCVLIMRK